MFEIPTHQNVNAVNGSGRYMLTVGQTRRSHDFLGNVKIGKIKCFVRIFNFFDLAFIESIQISPNTLGCQD